MERNIIDILKEGLADRSLMPAISESGSKTSTNYLQLAADVALVQKEIKALGMEKGNTIGICGKNTSLWAASYLAVLCSGGTALLIDEKTGGADIKEILNSAGAQIMIADKNKLREVSDKIAGLALDKLSHASLKGFNYRMLDFTEVDEDAAAICLYEKTGGKWSDTILTHGTLTRCIDKCLKDSPCGEGTSVLATRPMAHSFGCIYDLLLPLVCGAHLHIHDGDEATWALCEDLARLKPEYLCTNPATMERLVNSALNEPVGRNIPFGLRSVPLLGQFAGYIFRKKLLRALGGKVKRIHLGGCTLNSTVEKILRWSGIKFSVNYNMTLDGPQSYRN